MTTADESNRFFAQWFAARRVMVILRGHEPDEALTLATVAWEAGIDLVEVPIQGERGAAALAAVVPKTPTAVDTVANMAPRSAVLFASSAASSATSKAIFCTHSGVLGSRPIAG